MTSDVEALGDGLRSWLGDERPLWPLLGTREIERFLQARTLESGPTRVNAELSLAGLKGSVVLEHTRSVLSRLAEGNGAKLTVTGNLGRKFVAEMVEAFHWPDYEPEGVYQFNKVVNEPDFPPLHFLHILLQESGLVRRHKGFLKISRLGRSLMSGDQAGKLMHLLFTTTFDKYNTSYLDRVPLERWPQNQIGLVLCLLSQAADEWASPTTLMKRTAIPSQRVLDAEWDFPAFAFEGRVLRYLHWFGLFERRPKPGEPERYGRHEYRRAPLYDKLLSFEIGQERRVRPTH